MLVVPLIERKREGGALTPEEWSALIAAYTAGQVADYQMSALLMAVVLRGLERQELAALTDAMLASGQRLGFDSWSTPRVDKHSNPRDRKSTRLNSSHGYISYAVFCLKKKKIKLVTLHY